MQSRAQGELGLFLPGFERGGERKEITKFLVHPTAAKKAENGWTVSWGKAFLGIKRSRTNSQQKALMHAIGRCSVMQSSRQSPTFEAVLFGAGRQTLSEGGALDLIVACLVASRKQEAEMKQTKEV